VGSAAGVILGLPSETERDGEDLWKTCVPDGTMDFIIIIIIIIIIISCHRFSFFPGTSPLEPVVNPTTQASSLSL
jgi:hypothetical protein